MKPAGIGAAFALAAVGLAVMVLVEPLLGVAGGVYAAINVGYSLGLKQVPVAELADLQRIEESDQVYPGRVLAWSPL